MMKKEYWLRIGAGLILWTLVIGLFLINRPLGPKLSSMAAPPAVRDPGTPLGLPATLQPSPSPLPPVAGATAEAASPSPVATTAVPSEPTLTVGSATGNCNETGSATFLILGESSPSDNPPRGADAIRLVKVDFDHRQVQILDLPPELWVATPSLASQGTGETELSLVYYQTKNLTSGSEQDKMGAAVAAVAGALEVNFGFMPDHYLDIKQATFTDAVNALGGIDLTLPAALDGRPEGFEYFPAGSQHFSGSQALDFVRVLQPAGSNAPDEWQRMQRQDLVLGALRMAVTSPQNWEKIPALVGVFHQDILTDLSVKNLLDLACLMNPPGVQVQEEPLDPSLLSQAVGRVLLPNPTLVGQFIASRMGR